MNGGPKAKLKAAIIGCGAIAREHLSAIAALNNVEVAAVCDLSPVRAEAMAERFGISSWYVDHKQLLNAVTPDLVHITTPPASHFMIAEACLSAGINVLVEKPITVAYSEFCALRELAEAKSCLLVENHNYRYHSSVKRICDLIASGKMGDIIDVEIVWALDIYGPGSAYVDLNLPHHASTLAGGIVGDFLTHLAYLALLFAGPPATLRTIWSKHRENTPLITADEFRAVIKGGRATAYLSFSGNAQPNGFWLRVSGTRARAEANLFEPPWLTLRRARSGEPALGKLIDGVAEARDVFKGTIASFTRKLAGTSSYDGLAELVARTYLALETKTPPPVSLQDVDVTARLVDQLSRSELRL